MQSGGALCRHQLGFCVFSELWNCFLQQQSPTISFWRATNSFGNNLGLWVSIVPLWPTNLLDATHSWHQRFCLMASIVQFIFFRYLMIPFRFISYMYILRSFYYVRLGFHRPLKWPLVLPFPVFIPSLTPLFITTLRLMLPFQSPPHVHP